MKSNIGYKKECETTYQSKHPSFKSCKKKRNKPSIKLTIENLTITVFPEKEAEQQTQATKRKGATKLSHMIKTSEERQG